MLNVPTCPVPDTPVGVTLQPPLTVGLTNGSEPRRLPIVPLTLNLLSVMVLDVPTALVALTPVTATFASPSTSTDTEPKLDVNPPTEATAEQLTPILPKAEVPAKPETFKVLLDIVMAVPNAETPANPLTPILPPASTATPPLVAVTLKPVRVTVAAALGVTVPNAEVAAEGAVIVSGMGSPHVSCPHVPLPQPLTIAI